MHFFARHVWVSSLWLCLIFMSRAAAEDWLQYGHDGALTGRCSLAGNIDTPVVSWSYSTSGTELTIVLTPLEGEHQRVLSDRTILIPFAGRRRPVEAGPLQLDVEGNGELRQVVESHHERWGKILPDTPGLQRVCWSHTWTDQPVCRLQLFAYDQGSENPRQVWQSDPPEANIFNPLNIIYDIDGDGQFEIGSAGYGNGVRVIDPRTGTVLWSLDAPAPTCPKVASANIDGRPGDELIYPAGNQLVVITGDRSSGRVLWKWTSPASLSMPAIADTDGDGNAEIVLHNALGMIYCLDARQ